MSSALDGAYAEIDALARQAGLPTLYLPKPESEGVSDGLWLEEYAPGQFVLKYHELGRSDVYDVARGDRDQIVFEVIQSVVFSVASKMETSRRREGEDFRRQLFEIECHLMEAIKVGWGAKSAKRHAEILEQAPFRDEDL